MSRFHIYLLSTLFFSGIALVVIWPRQSSAVVLLGARPQSAVRLPCPAPDPPVRTITILPIAHEAESLNSPWSTAAADLATLDLIISCYRRHHDGNPVGSNEEIVAALCGRNPQNLAYLPREGSFFNGQGQLIDRWATPYFFHALARDHMEIHSAGPDRKMWTRDDMISR